MGERDAADSPCGESEGRQWVAGWRLRGLIQAGLVLLCAASALAASPMARFTESGDALVLESPGEGVAYKEKIPVHRSGSVRYFSAGVGIEERWAIYPPFPLQLVFTAGGKPYVAHVSVVVQKSSGKKVVTIPEEHTAGPWLFLDLPPGSYDISASIAGVTKRLTNVTVTEGRQRKLYVRWDEEPERPLETKAE